MAEQPDNTTKQKCLSTFATSSKGGASAGVPKTLDEALSEIGFGPFQWRLMMVLAVGQMADAMEITLLSFLAPCVQSEWGLSSAQTSSITSVVFAGELLGSLFWGPLADRRGRRATYLASLSAILAAGLASAGAEGYAWLLAARGLVGVGVGGGCVPFDFFAEVLPQERRGRALAFLQLFWGGGSLLVAAVAAAGLEAHGWRPLVLVCCAPVALAALAAHLYLPESPRWLLAQGRDREAKQVVLEAARLNGVDLEGFILVNSLRTGQGQGGGPAGWGKAAAGGPGARRGGEGGEEEGGFRELFADGAAWTTVPLAAVWAGIGFGYYATVLLIGTVFQKDDAAAGGCSFDEVNIMISAAAEMVALVVLHELVDHAAVGRRGAQAGLYALMAGATLVLGATGARGGASKAATSAAFLARGAAVAGFSATWIHTPELYPTRVRTTAHSFLYSVARVAAFCSAYWAYAPRVPLPWRTALVAVLAGTCAVLALGMRETSGAALDSPAAVARRSPHTAQEAETLLPHAAAAAAAAVAAEEAGGQGGGGGEAGLGEGGYDSSLRGNIKIQTVVL